MAVQESTGNRRRRRSEEELIEELEAKIKEVQKRKERRRRRTESPIAKDFERLKKHMSRFTQACLDNNRNDIANSILGFMTILEKQAKEIRDDDFEDEDDAETANGYDGRLDGSGDGRDA